MKKLYLIGNQKMNMSYSELEPYFEKLADLASGTSNVVGVCVPSVYLNLAKYMLEGSKVLYGAQNMYHNHHRLLVFYQEWYQGVPCIR